MSLNVNQLPVIPTAEVMSVIHRFPNLICPQINFKGNIGRLTLPAQTYQLVRIPAYPGAIRVRFRELTQVMVLSGEIDLSRPKYSDLTQRLASRDTVSLEDGILYRFSNFRTDEESVILYQSGSADQQIEWEPEACCRMGAD